MKCAALLTALAGLLPQIAMADVTATVTPTVTSVGMMTTNAVVSADSYVESCVNGAAYISCTDALTSQFCTAINTQGFASCGCSSASRAASCLNMCSITYERSAIDMVLSTCNHAAGMAVPTTNAAGQASAGTGSKAGAAHLFLPTGLTERFAVAAAAGIIGAIL